MIKLLIADDEPLVCVGVQSMLPWAEYGIEIVGTARNGQQAADMVEKLRPDIVITDIKMPLKTGLQLAEECARIYGRTPLFIILTSFEEFDFVRKAIGVQAVDYLIKLELDADTLGVAVRKAISVLQEIHAAELPQQATPRSNMQALRDKYFIRLFNNLFESDAQALLQMQELGLDFTTTQQAVGVFNILTPSSEQESAAMNEKLLSLYSGTAQMARETLNQYLPCYITTLDLRHFTVTFCFETPLPDNWQATIENALQQTGSILRNYFNVSIQGAVSYAVNKPEQLAQAYHAARQLAQTATSVTPFVFCPPATPQAEDAQQGGSHQRQTQLRQAFEEMDTGALYNLITELAAQLAGQPHLYVQALDTACSILYMAINLLPNGQQIVEACFADEADGYRSVYRINSVDGIVRWLQVLRDGCVAQLQAKRKNFKEHVVESVKAYIHENLDKKLSLNDVAAVFNFSPSYLSQLFAKYAGEGFVEYITRAKITRAKEMLVQGEGRVYEIAERLGFESSFYFSKVFKKVERVSPRQFIQRLEAQQAQIEEGGGENAAAE